jgi:hypothetical protein
MTTMGFRYLSGPATINVYPEDETSGSFKQGDLVALSSGEVILAAGFVDLLGVAQKAASGTVSTSIPVHIISSDQRWVCAGDTTTAATNVGIQYALNVTAGSQSVDLGSTTTDGGVVIEALDPRDGAHTGSGGRLIVHFAGGACVMDGTGAA